MAPSPRSGTGSTGRVRRVASIRPTRRGVGALMCGIATTTAGFALGLAEATSAGIVALAATGLTGVVVFVLALFPPPLVVRRVVEQADDLPMVGEELAIDVHLEPRRRTATAELIEVAVDTLSVRKGARSVRMAVRPLRCGEASVAQYRVVLRERGTLRFLPMTWRRTDPLGLYRWSHRVDRGGKILVGPAVVELDDQTRASLERLRPRLMMRRTSQPDPFEFRELRGYVPGDDFRRVHWTSSARRNELIIREPEHISTEIALPIRVVIDARHGEHASTLELALSIGASVVQALAEPFEVTVRTNDGDEHTKSAADTMILLARVDRETPRSVERTSRPLIDRASDDPAEVFVTGPHPAPVPEGLQSVVFAAGAASFEIARWEPGEPTRQAVASRIAAVVALGTSPHSADQTDAEPILTGAPAAPGRS